MFEDLQFSTQEFYEAVEKIIKEREIPDVHIERVSFSESKLNMFNRREYLRITRNHYVFDICAAPFGKGFFISWYLGETKGFFKELLAKIPGIGPLLVKASEMKTYYQMDSEAMFKESIRKCLNKAVDDLTNTKGVRAMSDFERQPARAVSN
jgi:hypothetical protein